MNKVSECTLIRNDLLILFEKFSQLGQFSVPTLYALFFAFCVVLFFTFFFWGWGLINNLKGLQQIKQRIISWWIILGLYILVLGIHPLITLFGFGLISFLAFREFLSQVKIINSEVGMRRVHFWAYIAIPIQYFLVWYGEFLLFILFIPVGLLFLLPFRAIISGLYEKSIVTFSILYWGLMLTVFSVSHIPALLFLPSIPGHEAGHQGTIFFLIFITQMNDVFQFLAGNTFGKHPLSPMISPNKTIEGCFGGLLGSLGMAYILAFLVPLTTLQCLFLGLFISVLGIFGDLTISSLKRDMKIKDMSNFIPGHGGVLDRLDSLTFASLGFFYFLYYLVYV